MPTPASGTISMLDMRNEITRGTGAIDMAEVRNRYGSTGAISFSELYDCEGYVYTPGSYRSKFINYDGWLVGYMGSVAPAESNSRLQIAAASFIKSAYGGVNGANTIVHISQNNSVAGLVSGNGAQVTVGYRATDVTRYVQANTVRTIQVAASNSTVSYITVSGWPGNLQSSPQHCLIKF